MKREIYIILGLIVIFSFVLVLPVKAGTLTEASTTPANSYVNNISTYSVSFKVASSTEIEAQIRLIFPAGFDLSAAANSTSTITTSSTLAAATVATSTVSGQELTLWLADGAVAVANDTIHFSGIPNIVNPVAPASYTLGIETRTQADGLSDAASSTAFSIAGAYAPRRSDSENSPPISNITSPTDGSTILAGEKYVIKGTAEDSGGSLVQSVEVSLNNGQSWFATAIKSVLANVFSWEYVWQNPTEGEYTIKVRATDTVGNIESPSYGVKVMVSAPAPEITEPEEEAAEPEKSIAEMNVQELRAKILEVQQQIVNLLQQLIQLIQAQL